MTVGRRIAEELLKNAITVGMLRQTMKDANVDMETAVNMWRKQIERYVDTHTEAVGWLKRIDGTEWTDPDNEDKQAEAIDNATTAGYVEGFIDGFTDAMKALYGRGDAK